VRSVKQRGVRVSRATYYCKNKQTKKIKKIGLPY
jgi:hypothetical protein